MNSNPPRTLALFILKTMYQQKFISILLWSKTGITRYLSIEDKIKAEIKPDSRAVSWA
jgi:hypothetical protein